MERNPGLRIFRDPLDIDGVLTEFSDVIYKLDDDISKLDGSDISSFNDVFRVFFGVTTELGVFVTESLARNVAELGRVDDAFYGLLRQFHSLVINFVHVIVELYDNAVISRLHYLHLSAKYYGFLDRFGTVVISFEDLRTEFGLSEDTPITDFIPRVSPASEKIIKQLEKVRINDEETCSICLEELPVGSEAIQLQCSHKFHEDCVVKWLRMSKICPYCRSESL